MLIDMLVMQSITLALCRHHSDSSISSISSSEGAIRVQSLFSPLEKSKPPLFLYLIEIVSIPHPMGLKSMSRGSQLLL